MENGDILYSFGEAILPKEFCVCGMRLLPFSLGNYLMLEKYRSPFLIPGDDTNMVQLDEGIVHFYLALTICSQTWKQNKLMLEDEKILQHTLKIVGKHIHKILFGNTPTWLVKTMRKLDTLGLLLFVRNEKWLFPWQVKFCRWVSSTMWKFMNKEKNFFLPFKIQQFREYIKYNTEIPSFNSEQKQTFVSGMDWRTSLFITFKDKLKYTDQEIFDMPMRELFHKWCSFAESQGGIRTLNMFEKKAIDEIMAVKNKKI